VAADKTAPTDFPLIVDAHVHLGSFRNFHIPDNDIHGVIRAMDGFGIDIGVIAAHAGISSDFRLGNDQVAQAADLYPDRVLGFCCVNPNYPGQVLAELERCFAHPAFRGIKLHPELHDDYPLDGSGYAPMWEFAAEREIPVLSHSYFGGDPLQVFGKLADRYPTVPLLLGHSGMDFPLEQVLATVLEHPNMWLDLCGALRWDGLVERLVEGVGAHRLLFGSDLPFINGASQLGTLVYARLPHESIELVVGGNARKLFRISSV
jgi:predicted TIM-barrel fold metal-dependent hydrolase